MTDFEKVPAKILIQVREGVTNKIVDFEVEIESSAPNDHGTIDHQASIGSIIDGLYAAISREANVWIAQGSPENADKVRKLLAWHHEQLIASTTEEASA